MIEPGKKDWETRVQNTAKAFAYPPTPDLASGLRQHPRHRARQTLRRAAQIAVIVLLLLIGLLAVPEIRAQVLALFHVGAVEVIVTTATPPARFSGGNLPDSVLDFPGATTLADAQQHAGYPVNLPTTLGAPDRVYLIQAEKPVVVLAWLDASGAVETSLHFLPPESYALKMVSGTPQPIEVNGRDALWLSGEHGYMLRIDQQQYAMRQVDRSALIWQGADDLTYRLETTLPEAEAVRIAESIRSGTTP